MNRQQFTDQVIRPVLKEIGMWSQEAEDLLLGTALNESADLSRITQFNNGPARGYFQMEMATYEDLMQQLPQRRKDKILEFKAPVLSAEDNLKMNAAFMVVVARMQYARFPEAIPKTLDGQARYWKKYWNTDLGAGKPQDFIDAFNRG